MKALLEKLDAKSITQVITSFGGLILAGYLVWFITTRMEVQLLEFTKAINTLNTTINTMQERSNDVIEKNTAVISAIIGTAKASTIKK